MTTKPSVQSKTNYFLRYRIAMWVCLFTLGTTSASIVLLLYAIFSEKMPVFNIIVISFLCFLLCLPLRFFWKEAVDFKNKSNWYYLFNGGKIEIPVNIIYTKPRLHK